jgi:hypothetical protein
VFFGWRFRRLRLKQSKSKKPGGKERCPRSRPRRCSRRKGTLGGGSPSRWSSGAGDQLRRPGPSRQIIQDALGIESDDVVNYCFPKDWPADREWRARIIGEWLTTEARFPV